MGRPSDLSREAIAELRALSTGEPSKEISAIVSDTGAFTVTQPLTENSVILLVFQYQGSS